MMFKRILVPLDGSDLAEQAVAAALPLAEACGADLLLLRSVFLVNMTMPVYAHEYNWAWPEYSREAVRAEARTYLDEVSERFATGPVTVEPVVTEGDPASDIVDTAVQHDVDLIVMSTHGWSGMKRWLIGSVTERVLESAPCPVLVARRVGVPAHIMTPLDGSDLAEISLKPAQALADRTGALLTLMRVVEAPERPEEEGEAERPLWQRQEAWQQMVNAQREQANSYLHHRAQEHEEQPPQTMTVIGEPVESILDCARLHSVDLIVITTHGHTGLRRWHYGSVTAKVMRGADCSVMVIRPPLDSLRDQ